MNKCIWAYIVILVIFLTLAAGSRIFSIHSRAVPKIVPPAPPAWLLTPRGAPAHVDKGVLGEKVNPRVMQDSVCTSIVPRIGALLGPTMHYYAPPPA